MWPFRRARQSGITDSAPDITRNTESNRRILSTRHNHFGRVVKPGRTLLAAEGRDANRSVAPRHAGRSTRRGRWRGTCKTFVSQLGIFVKAHDDLHLTHRYEQDVQERIVELDEQITVEKTQTEHPEGRISGGGRSRVRAPEQVILSGKKVKLQSDLALFRRRVDKRNGRNNLSIDGIQLGLVWYVEHCQGKPGCVEFSSKLRAMWQDICPGPTYHNADLRPFGDHRSIFPVKIGQCKRKLQALLHRYLGFDRTDSVLPRHRGASGISLTNTTEHLKNLDDLLTLTRHELLSQGALQLRQDHATDDIRHTRQAHTIEPPADLDRIGGRYNYAYKHFTEEHEKHGDLAAAASAERRTFVEANPDATPTEIATHIIRSQAKANAYFAKLQPVFTEFRNEAIAAGLAQHQLPAEIAEDLTEFGGDVPDDGAVDSERPGVEEWREQKRTETAPRIDSWLEAVDQAQPIAHDDVESDSPSDIADGGNLKPTRQPLSVREDDILPCESASCIAYLPGRRRRIERYRLQQGHN
ncbi:hypothetical protein LTR86_000186 [Recurvomyces mirabilis]|nr:hypothetical protein LTR86_000186 [Recurvomyces mirabilis]